MSGTNPSFTRRATSVESGTPSYRRTAASLAKLLTAFRSGQGGYGGNSQSIAARLLSTYLPCSVSMPCARSSKTLHLA